MMFQPISYFCSKRDACIDHYCYNYGMCISDMSGFPHVSLVSESRLAQHVLEVTELLFKWAKPLNQLFVCTLFLEIFVLLIFHVSIFMRFRRYIAHFGRN